MHIIVVDIFHPDPKWCTESVQNVMIKIKTTEENNFPFERSDLSCTGQVTMKTQIHQQLLLIFPYKNSLASNNLQRICQEHHPARDVFAEGNSKPNSWDIMKLSGTCSPIM